MSKLKSLAFGSISILIAILFISYPKQVLEGSIRGLTIWWGVVFPSLLPFFILSELLIAFGVVQLIGALVDPLMRPLFKVPGVGGFALAMGMATGFPAGAKFTARLRKERELTQIEAERLVSFTNSSNPLFILGAVSIGFFKNPSVGFTLAFSHYIGNILVGLVMRFYGKGEQKLHINQKISFKKAIQLMHRTRLKNAQPLGQMIGDAVKSSVQSLLIIGGFIMLFSVINRLLQETHILSIVANYLHFLFSLGSMSTQLAIPFLSGLLEMTLGSQLASATSANLLHQLMITSFLLGFSGLSVHAQVASILADTDIRFKPFFIARILHGMIAMTLTFFLWTNTKVTFHAVSTFMLKEKSMILHLWSTFSGFGPLITITTLVVYVFVFARYVKS